MLSAATIISQLLFDTLQMFCKQRRNSHSDKFTFYLFSLHSNFFFSFPRVDFFLQIRWKRSTMNFHWFFFFSYLSPPLRSQIPGQFTGFRFVHNYRMKQFQLYLFFFFFFFRGQIAPFINPWDRGGRVTNGDAEGLF